MFSVTFLTKEQLTEGYMHKTKKVRKGIVAGLNAGGKDQVRSLEVLKVEENTSHGPTIVTIRILISFKTDDRDKAGEIYTQDNCKVIEKVIQTRWELTENPALRGWTQDITGSVFTFPFPDQYSCFFMNIRHSWK